MADRAELELPHTWRPRKARAVMLGLAALTLLTMVTLAVFLNGQWNLADQAGLVLLGAVGAVGLGFLARPRIVASADRLVVVNVLRTWVLRWPQVIAIRMEAAEPWPTIDLADGTSIVAMGIQRSDGPRADAEVARLAALVHERGEAPDDDHP